MRTVRQLLEAKAPEVFAIGPDAPVIDNSGLPIVEGVRGQTAADRTCSVSNYY